MTNILSRIQNVPLSSLPNHLLPDNMSNTPSTRSNNVAPVPETGMSRSGVDDMTPDTCLGGYLDPETGQWVMESSSKRSSRSSSPRREERGRTPDKRGLNNTQVCTKTMFRPFFRFKLYGR